MRPKIRLVVLAAAAASLAGVAPARAQMPVIDGSNLAQAVKTVSQSLQQITLLQQQLRQETAMLQSIPSDVTAPFASIRSQALGLLTSASGLGFTSAALPADFAAAYPTSLVGQTPSALASAVEAWRTRTRQALQDALALQNAVVQSRPATSASLGSAVTASQAAPGQTAAQQATNQLLSVVSTQLAQLQDILLTQARASGVAAAEQQSISVAAQAESARAIAYTPPAGRVTGAGL